MEEDTSRQVGELGSIIRHRLVFTRHPSDGCTNVLEPGDHGIFPQEWINLGRCANDDTLGTYL